ncbi:MAG TPA: plastocyanin/azurin family copper-binding protein [Verrucomicrobiae bacterium]|jgi:plastocyanin|nr:plastocyanin/azurin family copper-binding protein [Verrucomicrobiae bacterium]
MIRPWLIISVLLALDFSSALAAEPANGVIKGSITIGGRPTADAVVSLEGFSPKAVKPQSAASKTKAVIDQKDLKFNPRVLAVMVGKTVDFPNHDKTFHNVFSTSEAKKFDLGLYPSGQSRSVNFDKPGVVKILCNVHPNMEAYVVVKAHPYFSVPDDRGNYSIKGAPMGKYRVEVWHPQFGVKSVPVELVRDGEVLAINLDLKDK